MNRTMLAAMAAILTLALPTMASAASNDMDVIVDGRTGAQTRSIAVSVADLNLTSSDGMRRAGYRVTRAAKQVCGWLRGSVLPQTPDYTNCFDQALNGARSDLDAMAKRQG